MVAEKRKGTWLVVASQNDDSDFSVTPETQGITFPITNSRARTKVALIGAPDACRQIFITCEQATRPTLVSPNCVFDASLVPETCPEFPAFANLMQDSIRQAKADMRLALRARR